ncbi:hypothetical protein J6590_059621 [Homalodisca vitripennis]|nr:hypothetical protein J6590_059621 [Homalodisca vitripennis]
MEIVADCATYRLRPLCSAVTDTRGRGVVGDWSLPTRTPLCDVSTPRESGRPLKASGSPFSTRLYSEQLAADCGVAEGVALLVLKHQKSVPSTAVCVQHMWWLLNNKKRRTVPTGRKRSYGPIAQRNGQWAACERPYTLHCAVSVKVLAVRVLGVRPPRPAARTGLGGPDRREDGSEWRSSASG